MNISSANSDRYNLDKNQYAFELKNLDYIPIISIVSGIARTAFGTLQQVAGLAQDTVSLVHFCFHPSADSSIDNNTSLHLRGKANIIRGSIAICPIVGNITLYLFDHSSVSKDWELRLAASSGWAF
jgi:hypothetical protein